MSFLQSMQQRYTTKKYDPSKKIDPQHIQELKEILVLSPSSINSQPWRFTFVSDKEVKKELSEVSWLNKSKVIDCDTVIVFSRINSPELFEKQIEEELPKGAVDYYREFLKSNPKEQLQAWFDRQVYLALGVLLSACAEMGIDATPMEGIEPENYDKVLGQTSHHAIVAVAIGYRDSEDFNQPHKNPKLRRSLEKVIHTI